jgi:hypothetical protein
VSPGWGLRAAQLWDSKGDRIAVLKESRDNEVTRRCSGGDSYLYLRVAPLCPLRDSTFNSYRARLRLAGEVIAINSN